MSRSAAISPGGKTSVRDSRRAFLSRLLAAWSLLFSGTVVFGLFRYLLPIVKTGEESEKTLASRIEDIPAIGVRMVRINKKPVMLMRTPAGQIKALSAVCTHLGCIVEFKQDDISFHCNCHGSVFDRDGKNRSGPAPRPLDPLKVEIQGNDVYVSRVL